jgi:SAM-dependent methyltransferase
MKRQSPKSDTDCAWEQWGRQDPYFGVITNPKFRRRELTDEGKHEFFESGRLHVDYVLHVVRSRIDPDFKLGTLLDFGCGVGRTLVAFARIAHHVIGLDVSPSMLKEAESNCREHRLSNVRLQPSDDALSSITECFDMIHSCIVFQHIPAERGRVIFRGLLKRLAPRGVGAFQFLYSKTQYADTYGIAPSVISPADRKPPLVAASEADPEMQMNPYNMNEILFLIQEIGVQRLHAEFTDHGGELGLFLFFQVT